MGRKPKRSNEAESQESRSRKLLVLGLDGTTFDVINPLVKSGKIPAISKILSDGSWGIMRSTIPPISPSAWTSLTTGVNPGKHGVFEFVRLMKDHQILLNTSKDKRAPEIWDYLLDRNVISVHVPLTFPPKNIRGVMVSGMLSPDINSIHTEPRSAREAINELFPDYEFDIMLDNYRGCNADFIEKIDNLLAKRIHLFNHLIEYDWELFFIVITETDRAQHMCWDTEVVDSAYVALDGVISNILHLADSGAINLFIVSDHGFRGVQKRLCVNAFLSQTGFLNYLERNRSLRDRSIRLAKALLEKRQFKKIISYIPERLKEAVPGDIKKHMNLPEKYDLDWSMTNALMLGSNGLIYFNKEDRINGEPLSENALEKRKREVSRALLNIRDPETGENVVLSVLRGEDLYSGPYVDMGPDLVVIPADGYCLSEKKSQDILEPSYPPRRGEHHVNGVFMAYGHDIASGCIEDIEIYDVLPTVLHALGSPIPSDIDGRVITEAFSPTSKPGKQKPFYYQEETPLSVSERISNLKSKGRF